VIIGKGALRIKEEFRKSFPNIPIYTSTADKEIENVPRKSIVIATGGMEPKGDFGGIISLDTLFLQNIPELRAEEKIRSRLFSLLNHLVDGGTFYLDLPANNRLSRAISLDSPESVIKEEIAERSQTKLPPNWRMIRIECEGVARAISGLLMEHPDVVVSYESSSVAILRSEVSKSGALTESIKLLQTYRSISKKSLLNIEMDPFKL
jgi:primosomal protein N'